MNNDLISRDALNETIDRITWYHINAHGELVAGAHYNDDALYKAEDIYKAIDNAPTVYPKQGEWILVSERLPDDLEPVNITWINHEPEPYYKEIKDKPFTATGVYFNGQWYWWSTLCTDTLAEYSHNFDDIIDKAIEIVAWQPLPEPYKKGGAK